MSPRFKKYKNTSQWTIQALMDSDGSREAVMNIYNQYVHMNKIQGDLSNYGPSPEWIWRNLCEMALHQMRLKQ